jgi:micrococcal nuclease
VTAVAFIRLLAGLILLFTPMTAACTGQQDELRGQVTWIHDGDTLEVRGLGKVRLLGIDCPEKEGSARDRFYRDNFNIPPSALRRTARAALAFNIQHVKGRQVTLQFDGTRRDRYGRLLAYVMLPDGRCLNHLLLEKGMATVYRKFDFSRKNDFFAAEQRARRSGLGMWRTLSSSIFTPQRFKLLRPAWAA